MNEIPDKFIPALRFNWLTSLYDPVARFAVREYAYKPRLVEQIGIRRGHRVLDLGCGTATLSILTKRAHPEAEVIGLDCDPKILEIARAKVAGSGVDIKLDRGMAFKLPYPDDSFDRVVSSLLFHHLSKENKLRAFREIFRVLRPGGELHVADLGKPQNILMSILSLLPVWLEKASENIRGLLPQMFREAGFEKIEETARYMTIFGTLSLYRMRKPE